MELRTARLVLRPLRDDDLPAFTAMNADPVVMEHLSAALTPEQSAERLAGIRALMARHGFGQMAVELPGEAQFIGLIGISHFRVAMPFTPDIQLAWRLARPWWGRGYATEAARACAEHAIGPLGLDEVVAVTIPVNRRSRRVMESVGMTRDPAEDFDHPNVAEGDPRRRHVLYRLRAPA